MRHVLFSSLISLAVQAVLFFCWTSLPLVFAGDPVPLLEVTQLSVFVVGVAAAHLLLLGLPGFWVLKKAGKATTGNVLLLGFLIGCLGIAIFSWPAHSMGSSHSATWHGNFTELVVNGKPTIAGWFNYLEGVALFGAYGLFGALAFHTVWRRRHAV